MLRPTLETIVDVERYLRGERRAQTIASARRAVARTGSVTLEGFVLPHAVSTMLEEVKGALSAAYRRDARYSAYGAEEAVGDARHPTQRMHRYALDSLACDAFTKGGTLDALYRDPEFIAFVAEILREPRLFALADPLLGLTATILREGDEHGWHFDRNDFVVSLLLQRAEGGGRFEFAPFVRSENQPNFSAVESIMDGDRRLLHDLDVAPGTLALFEGKRSLHRVTPVTGSTPRIIALLSYDRKPDVVHEEAIHLRTFGRTATNA